MLSGFRSIHELKDYDFVKGKFNLKSKTEL